MRWPWSRHRRHRPPRGGDLDYDEVQELARDTGMTVGEFLGATGATLHGADPSEVEHLARDTGMTEAEFRHEAGLPEEPHPDPASIPMPPD